MQRLLGVFKAFSLKIDPPGSLALGLDVDPLRGVADSGRFGEDLAALFGVLGETARDVGVGVLILVDELQEAQADELRALNTSVHQVGQTEPPLPLVLVGAGLPSLPAQLADATSYAERLYDFRVIGPLDEEASRAALVVPARGLRADWAQDGLALAVEAARGYPYFLQAVGKHVWDSATSSPIDIRDVEVGLAEARREVDAGLYRSRWERATPAQRELLRAVAVIGGDAATTVSDVATRMGKRPSDLSVARNELIKKGLLYAPERGFLALTVPGMHEFIDRQV